MQGGSQDLSTLVLPCSNARFMTLREQGDIQRKLPGFKGWHSIHLKAESLCGQTRSGCGSALPGAASLSSLEVTTEAPLALIVSDSLFSRGTQKTKGF